MCHNDDQLGRELLAQAVRESQEAVSDDEIDDTGTLQHRFNEGVEQTFDLMVSISIGLNLCSTGSLI